jgi:hypothetical protein
VRKLACAVLVAAALATGCGHGGHVVSAADRKLCEAPAAQAGAPGSAPYKGVYDECVHNLRHPERGGG